MPASDEPRSFTARILGSSDDRAVDKRYGRAGLARPTVGLVLRSCWTTLAGSRSSAISKHVADRGSGHGGLEPRLEPGEVRLAIDAGAHIRAHRQ